ncbi:MAG TPA: hypothetical protein VIC33_14440 [Vicinamibacterales bacterium]
MRGTLFPVGGKNVPRAAGVRGSARGAKSAAPSGFFVTCSRAVVAHVTIWPASGQKLERAKGDAARVTFEPPPDG